MTQGERIKELRKELEMTLDRFGERIGLKKAALSTIENGKCSVTDANIKSICREFNVNETWLRTGEGDMFVQMDRDEQIASFIGRIQSDAGETFKKRFISMLSSLDESEWEVLEKMALMIYEKKD